MFLWIFLNPYACLSVTRKDNYRKASYLKKVKHSANSGSLQYLKSNIASEIFCFPFLE